MLLRAMYQKNEYRGEMRLKDKSLQLGMWMLSLTIQWLILHLSNFFRFSTGLISSNL